MLNIQQLLLKRGMKGTNYVPGGGGGGEPEPGGTYTEADLLMTRVAGDEATVRSMNVIPLPPNTLLDDSLSNFRIVDVATGDEVACYAEFIYGTHADRVSPNGVYVEVETNLALGASKAYKATFTLPSNVTRLSKTGYSEYNDISFIADPSDTRFFKLENDIWLFNWRTGVPYKIAAQQIPWPTGSDITADATLYVRRGWRVSVDLAAGTITLVPGSTSTGSATGGQVANDPLFGHSDGNIFTLGHIGIGVNPGSTNFTAGSTALDASHVYIRTPRINYYKIAGALLLPTSAAYLCACETLGKRVTQDAILALGTPYSTLENEARTATYEHWGRYGSSWAWQGAAYYGGTTVAHYEWFVGTGDLVEYLKARAGQSYRLNRWALDTRHPEWNASNYEFVVDYMFTGNEDNLTACANFPIGYGDNKVEDFTYSQRSHARLWELTAWYIGRLGRPKPSLMNDYASVDAFINAGLTALEAEIAVSGQEGRYPSTDYCVTSDPTGRGGHTMFGVCYVMNRLLDLYDYYADGATQARIVAILNSVHEYTWGLWDETTENYYYQDVIPCSDNSDDPEADLNGFAARELGFLLETTEDVTYYTRLDKTLKGARNCYFQGLKQNTEHTNFARVGYYHLINSPV